MTNTANLPAIEPETAERPPRLPYGALVTMMLMSFLLVTAEFLPNGMLIEMAADLGITPGQAGQTVTVTAFVGLIVAPTVGLVFPRLDRRRLLVWTAAAAGVSSVLVAIAPSLILILLARVLLGAAISTFWTMSITVASRLAGPERLGRAVMFTTAGMSLATVAGVPLGVMLGELVDWRWVFLLVGVVSALLALPLRLLLPTVPAAQTSSPRFLAETLRLPGVGSGLAGHVLVVLGHFLAYTYIRVALERIEGADAGTVVLLLALFGAGGFLGNVVIGAVIDRTFVVFGVVAPLTIAVMSAAVIAFPGALLGVAAAVFVWGFFFASWLIIVNTWVGHRMPDRLEAGGGLVVVGFQLGIVIAAGFGGLIIDAVGVTLDYALAAVLLVLGAVLFGLANRRSAGDRNVMR
ncbi:putative MFS family arabinose efflux permease [Labedella gwakjiensis]|uniref:MFS transporter n=1 Tax=Labedella gwakjiensis TaxID=390269 RepID=A0A2P8GYS5_9MICO|nr:MFS transporter [Labedella gwakjiensis]PSL39110.1 putative MFS family arabinose efflux permease [Labedella gwakjiensis]RUQ86447.1 MFS transporter [Labedella gwakjiensis]